MNEYHGYAGFPKMPDNPEADKKVKAIMKELYDLIKVYEKGGLMNPANAARQFINRKYGKGWREKAYVKANPDNHQ